MKEALEKSKLALAAYKEQKYQDALALYNEAVKLFDKYFSTTKENKPKLIDSAKGSIFAHTHIASCYFAIGNCYKNLSQYQDAIPYFYACLEISDKTDINLTLEKIQERIRLTEMHIGENTLVKAINNKWINIPQGRTGRLIARVNYLQIAGLYTDRFSTCVVVIMKAKNRISMTHLDHMENPTQTPCRSVLEEYEWAYKQDQECEFIVVYNQYGQERVKQIEDLISTVQKSSNLPLVQSIKLKKIQVDDSIQAVKISFSQGIEYSKAEIRPWNLVCHPKDLVIHTNRKIECIFFLSNQCVPKITKVIFDGRFFEPIENHELSPFLASEREHSYFSELGVHLGYMGMAVKLLEIFQKIKSVNKEIIMLIPENDLCSGISKYVCMHLKKYDVKKIFFDDMAELVHDNKLNMMLIEEDHLLIKEIEKALSNPDTALIETQRIVENLGEARSKFQEFLIDIFEVFFENYSKLQAEKNRQHQAVCFQKQAGRLTDKAQQYFLQKNYEAAKNLYLEAFQLLSHSVTRDDLQLIKSCESVGNCYYQLNMFDEAFEYFWVTKNLLTIFHSQNTYALARVDKFMGLCQGKGKVKEVTGVGYVIN